MKELLKVDMNYNYYKMNFLRIDFIVRIYVILDFGGAT